MLAPAVFVLIWSTGFIVARLGMPHAPPWTFLLWRFLLSFPLFLGWAWMARSPWPVDRRTYWHLAVMGALMHAGYLGGVWSAVKAGMGAGLVSMIVALQPILTAILVQPEPGFKDGGRAFSGRWLGLGLGFVGVVLVLWQKLHLPTTAGALSFTSVLFALAALLSITFGTLYQKRHLAPVDLPVASSVQLLAAAVIAAPLAGLESEGMAWNEALVFALGWSVLGLTLGASSLLYLLIRRGAVTAVASLMYLVPPTTAILAWVWFDEPVTGLTLVGTAFVAAGVALAIRR